MKQGIRLSILASLCLVGCASTSHNSVMSNEEFEALQSGKADAVIVKHRQSHGLVGDLIHEVLPHPND